MYHILTFKIDGSAETIEYRRSEFGVCVNSSSGKLIISLEILGPTPAKCAIEKSAHGFRAQIGRVRKERGSPGAQWIDCQL